jgi:hypothetical protein
MTAIQRWRKPVMYSIIVALLSTLSDYFTGDLRADHKYYYMLTGVAFFVGWLGGSPDAKRQS